uniref:Uncharacterized protein n=1 Tax=viral metagenome TaxID=1070528 RepID=A0A6C0F470_9ZZZZ
MTGVNKFLTNKNASTLWEVLKEDALKNKTSQEITEIHSNFDKIMTNFFDEQRINFKNLIDINKKFILSFMKITENKTQLNDAQNVKAGLYKVEDIQEARMQQFDKKYEKRKKEFENSMMHKIPDSPNFADNVNDTPLENIESLIAETMRQRNFEIDQIVSGSNTNKAAVENWLHPQETSLKTENRVSNEQNFKLIKIENEEVGNRVFENDVINLTAANTNANRSTSTNEQKKLSWAKNNEMRIFDKDENISMDVRENLFDQMKPDSNYANIPSTNDIFSKLKPINTSLSFFESKAREEKGIENENLLQNILQLDNKIDIIIKNQTTLIEFLQKMQPPTVHVPSPTLEAEQ